MTDALAAHVADDETTAVRVAWAAEDVRLAEASLERRRQRGCGPSATTREAMRLIADAADGGTPITPTELAKALDVTGASTTHIVRRLTENGLVTTVPIKGDRRSKGIIPQSRRLDPDAVDPLNRAIRSLAADLPPADARVVADFLDSLATLIDEECR